MGGQSFDTSPPTGKLMLTLLRTVAGFERNLMLNRQPSPSDLSDAGWSMLAPFLVSGRRPPAGPLSSSSSPGGSPMRRSTSCARAASGASCRASSRRGRPSTTTTAGGGAQAFGSGPRPVCASGTAGPLARQPALGGDHRQPGRAHDGSRRATRLRRGQEDLRPQAAGAGGHARQPAEGQGTPGRRALQHGTKGDAVNSDIGPGIGPASSQRRSGIENAGVP